jgi:hypothetical protein
MAFMSIVVGCQNNTEQTKENTSKPKPKAIPITCKQPAQVLDIWKLEPILVKRGEITDSMTKDEKAKIIKSYITRKNDQYRLCLKNSKG